MLCCRSAGFGASGISTCPADTAESHRVVGRRAEASPAGKHQPSGGVQASRRLKPSLLVQCNSLGLPGWRRLGNYLSASSVPHNWLSFANSQLGWEGAKSLEGASSRHKTLPKISGPFPPAVEINSSGSPSLRVPSAQSQATLLTEGPRGSWQGSRTSQHYLSPPPCSSPHRRGGTAAETPCNSGCHCPNYTPRSSRQHRAPCTACIMGFFLKDTLLFTAAF